MQIGELFQAVNQPFGGEGRRDGHGKRTRGFGIVQSLGRRLQLFEAFAQAWQIGRARFGQGKPPLLAVKKLYAQVFLKPLDLMTDGRRRYMQFIRSPRHGQVPGGGFKGAERVQGRQSSHELRFIL